MKNPRIKTPKLVFQTEIEKALLMPAAVLGEFRARRGQDPWAHRCGIKRWIG